MLTSSILPEEFQRHAGLIIQQCIRYFPSFRTKRKPHEIQDMYSIVAAKLWKKRDTILARYDPSKPFPAYLRVIVQNILRKELAKKEKSVAALSLDEKKETGHGRTIPANPADTEPRARYHRYLQAKSKLGSQDQKMLFIYEENRSKLQTYLKIQGIDPATLTPNELIRAQRRANAAFESLARRLRARMNT